MTNYTQFKITPEIYQEWAENYHLLGRVGITPLNRTVSIEQNLLGSVRVWDGNKVVTFENPKVAIEYYNSLLEEYKNS